MTVEPRTALWEDPDPQTNMGRDLWDRLVNEGYGGTAFLVSEERDIGQRICQIESEARAAALREVAEKVAATLAELSESPLPGARYAHDVVRRRFAILTEATGASDQ